MDGSTQSWQPAPRIDDSGYGERMSQNNSYSGPKSGNFTGRSPRREEFKVYIRNVPLDMTKESLGALFGSCGTVVSTNILEPKEGRNSTIGFVGFAAEEEVTSAIERMSGTQLGENRLVVEKAAQKDRGGTPRRDQDAQFQRRDFQHSTGNQNERPSFQGYRAQNEQQPQRDGHMGQQQYGQPAVNGPEMNNHYQGMGVRQEEPVFNPRGPGRGQQQYGQPAVNGPETSNHYQGMGIRQEEPVFNPRGPGWGQQQYSQPAVNGPEMSNHYQGMGVRQEEPVFNPRGPGRGGGGNPNEQPSFQGYNTQNFDELPQRSGNAGQWNYNHPAVNGPEMMNNHQGMGVAREEAVFNPRGPGRGGIQNEQQSFQQPMHGGSLEQQNYRQAPDMTRRRQGMGVRQEEAVFNPRGPGRGGGVINQPAPSHAPGGGNSYMNGMPNEYSNAEGQGNSGSWRNEGQQQWTPATRSADDLQQNMAVTGRLPQGVTSTSIQNGGQSCHKYGEVGHFARECPNQEDRGGKGGQTCHKCGETGHFARDCPNQGERRGRGDQTCYKCGEVGHMARDCSSSGGLDKVCHKCGEEGHFARDCPALSSTSGSPDKGDRSCFNCGEVGHFSRECPNQENGRKGDQSCFNCGEVGHFSRECPNQENGRKGDRSCFNCGEVGHFSRECPKQENGRKGTENKVAPVTYVPPELPSNIDDLFQDAPHSGLNFDKYDEIPVQVSGTDPVKSISSFEEAGILEQCGMNIMRAKFTKPTPVQKHAIPITLAGRDLMACAQTGSGKTVAYVVPVLTGMIKQGYLSGGYLSGETQTPAALCLAPTRELADQIYKEVCKFSYGTVVSAAVCYGGVSVQHQLDKIRRGCHFLVATPGRLLDFINRKRVSLENVRYLILDEADRMLDMGFENDVRNIVERCGMPDKANRQTLMYSATFPDEIQRLAADFLKENYLFVVVGKIGGSNLDISQTVISVPGDDKQEKLFELLLNSGTDRTLIFVELKRVADFLACLLSQNKFPTTSISGDRTQQEREAALRDFRSGRAPVLVATSVAARGLDIPDVKHVINFDLPQDIEEYVHRIGRTGRIGNKGRATSFFQPGKDEKLARSLVKVLSEAYQEVPEWLEQVAEEAIGSSYGPAGGRFASKDTRQRDHSRAPAYDQPRMSGPGEGMGAVTKGMERVSVQPPSQYSSRPREMSNNQDEEEWD